MVFTHADPAPPPMVEHAVAVAPPPSFLFSACGGGKGRRRRQRLRISLAATLEVETLISKVAKNRCSARRQPRRAAVLMNAGADIEAGRRNVGDHPVRTGAHDHVAALLLR